MSDETGLEGRPAEEFSGDAPETDAPPAEQAKPKKAQKKPAKGKAKAKSGGAKSSKAKGGKGEASAGVSVATHPRAHAQVRRAKGWGGLGGFVIAAYVSYQAGVPPEQVGIRALAAGAAGYLVAWGVAVTVWRHLVLAELRARYEERRAVAPKGIPLAAGGGGPKEDESAA